MYNLWRVKLLAGLLAILFGMIAIVNTGATLLILFIWFIAFAIVDGIFGIVGAFSVKKENKNWYWGLIAGVISILIGLVALVWPQITATILLYFIAARAIIQGILIIVASWQLRQEVKGEWLMLVAGICSVFFGLWMAFQPLAGGLILLWVIGIYAVVVGILMVIDAFRSRGRGAMATA